MPPLQTDWVGLATDHRRLFDASQDGWIRPQHSTGLFLGRRGVVAQEAGPSAASGAIPVQIRFASDRLPFRPGAWREVETAAPERAPLPQPAPIIQWLAPLPLYAASRIEVPTAGQRTHMLAMAGQFSNVSLPVPRVEIGALDPLPPPPATDGVGATALELPPNLNAVQGAMAMAVWAVPRAEQWARLLCLALNRDSRNVALRLHNLKAPWLHLPWMEEAEHASEDNAQEALWRASLRVLQCPGANGKSPVQLARAIAQKASRSATDQVVDGWLRHSLRILSAEERITIDGSRHNAAGLAIQLALLRSEPGRFETWSKDLPGLSPAVWWAGAVLCGWRCGYRALHNPFRGDRSQQEYLSVRSLAVTWNGGGAGILPASQQSSLVFHRDRAGFSFMWGENTVLERPWNDRLR